MSHRRAPPQPSAAYASPKFLAKPPALRLRGDVPPPTRAEALLSTPHDDATEPPSPPVALVHSTGPSPNDRQGSTRRQKNTPKQQMDEIFAHYLASQPAVPNKSKTPELEIRFQGIGGAPLTKLDYDAVIRHLVAAGFHTSAPDGTHILRVLPEYVDRGGRTKISNVRAEITGVDLIQEYCNTNSIQHLLNLPSTLSASSNKIVFSQKTPVFVNDANPDEGKFLPVDNPEFRYRVGYQYETSYGPHAPVVRPLTEAKQWADSKKVFRHLNRVQFAHPDYPVLADITVLRTSAKSGKHMVPQYTIQDAKVFTEPESYEVELEIDNLRVGPGTPFDTPNKLLASVRKVIRIVLSAIQGTNFPVGESEMQSVLRLYQTLLYGEDTVQEAQAAAAAAEAAEPSVEEEKEDAEDEEEGRTPSNLGNRFPIHFIGPSSCTLQMENIVNVDGEVDSSRPATAGPALLSVPNIRHGYTVTDKADGERKLLLIDATGRMYFLDSNLRVQFTGMSNPHKELFCSLFDGEHIKYNKTHQFINLFAVFDVYYLNKRSVRELPFARSEEDEAQEAARRATAASGGGNKRKTKEDVPPVAWTRLQLMSTAVKKYVRPALASSSPGSSTGLRVECKEFFVARASDPQSIFRGCGRLLKRIHDGLFEYATDGLVFTPAAYGVGGGPDMAAGPLVKHTWTRSFKWKPAQFNTVDFLVRIEKDDTGKDKVYTEYEPGVDVSSTRPLRQYKRLILHCGFDEKRHGFANPFQQLLEWSPHSNNSADNVPNDAEEVIPKTFYSARPFQPTNPADPQACICDVHLQMDHSNGHLYLVAQDGHYFGENAVVEFRYCMDPHLRGEWRWQPLRVRHDKSAAAASASRDLLALGASSTAPHALHKRPKSSFGNDFSTANSNWYSIHHPITEDMLSTGNGIPNETLVGEDVYYNRKTSDTNTRGLRDFHNLYVKSKLIRGAANRGDTLIDYTVGKAGDLPKWRAAGVKFVLGIDIKRDNVFNRVDGACARFLSEASKTNHLPAALFLHGNSALNLRDGSAFDGHKEKKLAQAVFGEGSKVRAELGETVHKYFAIAEDGFNVSSCQFSLHYFFENVHTLHQFARNVAECTKVGGLFVGTCWDGKTVFELLKPRRMGDSHAVFRYGTKLFSIGKLYDYSAFPDDELSLGYPVSVYQESIGQHFVEYLVNFDFFFRVMENYGFVLVPPEETVKFGFSRGSGMFSELFHHMMDELRRQPSATRYGMANAMTEDEKAISFLNRYFILRKTHHVDAKQVTDILQMSLERTPHQQQQQPAEASGDADESAPLFSVSRAPLSPWATQPNSSNSSNSKKRYVESTTGKPGIWDAASPGKDQPDGPKRPKMLRRLPQAEMTIDGYDPVEEEVAVSVRASVDAPTVVEPAESPAVEPATAIRLAPQPKVTEKAKVLKFKKDTTAKTNAKTKT
jgi:hypothetical protein